MLMHALSVEDMTKKSEDILHAGRLGKFDESVAAFTSSIDIDPRLLEAVVQINSAHVLMLSDQKILDNYVARSLLRALQRIPRNIKLSKVLEDVHMNVEYFVISFLGKDVGGMLNLAKSRNDQVATAIRMDMRKELSQIAHALIGMESSLISQAKRHASTVMPGYTHLQRAQPVTVGHHLLAHFDALERDIQRLRQCFNRTNISPMGAGALASSSFDVDRRKVAYLLGFAGVVENSLDAVSSRDFATEAIYVCAQILNDLSKFAEELVLWTSKEFSFVEIPDKYTSTSSLMPQKKNPVVPEIVRAKAAQAIGDLVGALGIMKSLPLTYNLDLQELSRNLWSTTDKALHSLIVFGEMVRNLKFNETFLEEATKTDEALYATELADYLVTAFHLSFREAHSRVASLVRYAASKNQSSLFRSLGERDLSRILRVPITVKEVESLIEPLRVLSKRKALGAPNPKLVIAACVRRERSLVDQDRDWNRIDRKLTKARRSLDSRIEKILANKAMRMNKSAQKEVTNKEKGEEVKQ